ncbi:MAG TPA: 2-phospho-L-lactate guanylyltransferase [Halobacteria archaeon]|jgi:2-phospho-L-lactate guanylyltransferase|nr:2-phospho-L-lactate guanylyltransferase [Halobacteria archaeon]HIH78545.1 2-phospho-L-lactate guanylyltransferase [Halobacteria archaeon]
MTESDKLDIIIPFKWKSAKSRLSNMMNLEEREEFALKMFQDVLNTIISFKRQSLNDIKISVLTTTNDVPDCIKDERFRVIVDTRRLNDALNELISVKSIEDNSHLLILMSDLPLVNTKIIQEILNREEDLIIVPGRKGGTNMLFIKNRSKFRVDYYGISFKNHEKIAIENGLSYHLYDSLFAGTDIDEEEDLLDLLVFGEGEAKKYLERLGFVAVSKGEKIFLDRQ